MDNRGRRKSQPTVFSPQRNSCRPIYGPDQESGVLRGLFVQELPQDLQFSMEFVVAFYIVLQVQPPVYTFIGSSMLS